MELKAEYLKISTAMIYVDIKEYRTFRKFCRENRIPIISNRVSKTVIDKKLSGSR